MVKHLYEVLGLHPDASGSYAHITADQIKKAYRRKAAKLHPDKPDGDAERFMELDKAYNILSDEAKRKIYDETGNAEQADCEAAKVQAHFSTIFLEVANQIEKGPIHFMGTIDVLAKVRQHILTAQTGMRQQRQQIDADIVRVKRIAQRLKVKDPKGGYLLDAINRQLAIGEQSLKAADYEIHFGTLLLAQLDLYEYKIEPPQYPDITTGPGAVRHQITWVQA